MLFEIYQFKSIRVIVKIHFRQDIYLKQAKTCRYSQLLTKIANSKLLINYLLITYFILVYYLLSSSIFVSVHSFILINN